MKDDSLIALVVDPNYGQKLRFLDARMPIWAVKSPTNESAWNPAESAHQNSALFSADSRGAINDNVIGALVDIDEHFGAHSFPSKPYVGILVIGTALSADLRAALEENGFKHFRETDDGFEARFE
jgi:hypothetical protein